MFDCNRFVRKSEGLLRDPDDWEEEEYVPPIYGKWSEEICANDPGAPVQFTGAQLVPILEGLIEQERLLKEEKERHESFRG